MRAVFPTSHTVTVTIEPMRIRTDDSEVPVRDLGTIEVGRRLRDADVGI
jgi:hypothetical protein